MKNHELSGIVLASLLFLSGVVRATCTFENGVLTVNGETDLAGKDLTFENVTSMTGTGSFTDSVGGGVLTLGVAEGVTINNGKDPCLIQFSGGLKLVKTGPGTLAIAGTAEKCDTHSFSKGLEVRGGTLKTDKYGKMAGQDTPFGRNAEIDVYPGATLDLYGCTDLSSVTINLRGGALTSSRAVSAGVVQFALNVLEDSSFEGEKQFNLQGPLNLNGKTLICNLKNELQLHPGLVGASTGKIKVVHDGSVTLKAAKLSWITKDDGTPIDLSSVDLETEVKMNVVADVDVRDYVASNTLVTEATNEGTGTLRVHGTFVPNAENYYPVTLVDGAAIDLSGKTAPWTMKGVTIAGGAKIAVRIGARQVADGEMLVTWPAGGAVGSADTFTIVGPEGAPASFTAVWSEEIGLAVRIADTKVVAAAWTGDAKDGDLANPANWACTNKNGEPVENSVPDRSVAISIPYGKLASVSWPGTAAESYGVPALTGEAPAEVQTLAADRDWTGLGAMDFPFSMDLAGHELRIQLPAIGKDETSAEQSVTSSTAGGRLCVLVAGDDVYKNTTVVLSGLLTLVKEGAGGFEATVTNQTYCGGTEIKGGRLSVTMSKQMFTASGPYPLGATGSVVTVSAGGVLDVNNKYKFADAGYSVVLDGGQLYNDGKRTGAISTYPMNPDLILLADSIFQNVNTNNFAGSLTLNDHELTTTIGAKGNLRWAAKTVSAGTLVFAGVGQALLTVEKGLEMRSTNLRMAVPMTIAEGQTLTVGDYVVDYAGEANVAAGELVVTGTLKPTAAGLYPCTLADGAAIDLREKGDVWTLPEDVSFDENATVRILVTEPEVGFRDRTLIMSWTNRPATAGLGFVLDETLTAKGYRLTRDANGLSVGRKSFMLMIQ